MCKVASTISDIIDYEVDGDKLTVDLNSVFITLVFSMDEFESWLEGSGHLWPRCNSEDDYIEVHDFVREHMSTEVVADFLDYKAENVWQNG